jgi:GGDEF domain-containing protein
LIHWNLLASARAFLPPLEYAAFAAGSLLAWRFRSSRALFALLVIFLAQRAIVFYAPGHAMPAASGLSAWHAIAWLLPLNFVLLALIEESGFVAASIIPLCVLLFVQAVGVAAFSRTNVATKPVGRLVIPVYAEVAFLVVAAMLLLRWLLVSRPLEGALFWVLSASFLALRSAGLSGSVNYESTLYFTAAVLMLSVALVETSYRLAYHDELTGLPSRRAFQEALRHLEAPYTIAAVDIDHFKKFNDNYGHDTGDQVLRLVAARLARISGGGLAYRCGGEEFNILFPGKIATDVLSDLERLRSRIEAASFHLRCLDRRAMPREAEPERRSQTRGRKQTGRKIRQLSDAPRTAALSVTVSIGVAGAQPGHEPESVLRTADHALYRAKGGGRNRVETASSLDRRLAKTASIA